MEKGAEERVEFYAGNGRFGGKCREGFFGEMLAKLLGGIMGIILLVSGTKNFFPVLAKKLDKMLNGKDNDMPQSKTSKAIPKSGVAKE